MSRKMGDRTWFVLNDAVEECGMTDDPRLADARRLTRSKFHQRLPYADGRSFELWEDSFPNQRLAELDAAVVDLRRHWSERIDRPQLAKALTFDGVDLREIIEYGLQFYLVEAVRNAEIALALFAEEMPERVVVAEPATTIARILRQLCSRHGIPFESESVGADTAVGGKRRGCNPLAAARILWKTRAPVAAFRRSSHAVRVLLRGPRVAHPFVEVNGDRQAALAFRPGIAQMTAFLAVASIFDGELWKRRRAAAERRLELRRLYRELEPPTLPYRDLDLWPCLKPALDVIFEANKLQEHVFENAYADPMVRSIGEVLEDVLFCGYTLERTRPSVVLVAYDSSHLDKTMVSCARVRGIPSASIQHGIPGVYFPLHADRFFTWGEGCRRFYVAHGEPSERMVVTGRARQESTRDRGTDPCELRRRLGVADGTSVVLWIGQPTTGIVCGASRVNWERQLLAVVNAMATVAGARLWVRPHPSESEQSYAEVIEDLDYTDFTLVKEPHLFDLIRAADVVLLNDSTVCLDVVELGKPLVVLDLYSYPNPLPFAEHEGFELVDDPARLTPAIRRALEDPRPAAGARSFFAEQVQEDGVAAARAIHDALAELVSADHTSPVSGRPA